MKKLILLFFACLLVLGACGQNEENASKDDSKESKKEVKKDEAKKKETDKKDKVKKENKEKESAKKDESTTDEQHTKEVASNEQQTSEEPDTTSIQYQNSRQCLLDLGAGNRTSTACENMGNDKSINLQAFNDLQAEGYLCDDVAGCVTQEEMDKQQNEEITDDDVPDSSETYENEDEDIEQQEMDEISRKMDDPNISDDEYNKLVDEYNSYID